MGHPRFLPSGAFLANFTAQYHQTNREEVTQDSATKALLYYVVAQHRHFVVFRNPGSEENFAERIGSDKIRSQNEK